MLPPFSSGCTMCSKCEKITATIEHYERIRAAIGDQLTVDRIKELVAEMRAEKVGLHLHEEDRS